MAIPFRDRTGADPKRAMDKDVVRFKPLSERGKTSAHGEAEPAEPRH